MKSKDKRKAKLLIITNIQNDNYSNAMNLINKRVFNKEIEVIFNKSFDIINIFVKINLNSQAVKHKRIK